MSGNPPSFVQHKDMRFLIFDAPNDENLQSYVDYFDKYNVSHVVRVCEPTYDTTPLKEKGIEVHDWEFSDGGSPPEEIVDQWRDLVAANSKHSDETIGIHCVAGLGR